MSVFQGWLHNHYSTRKKKVEMVCGPDDSHLDQVESDYNKMVPNLSKIPVVSFLFMFLVKDRKECVRI